MSNAGRREPPGRDATRRGSYLDLRDAREAGAPDPGTAANPVRSRLVRSLRLLLPAAAVVIVTIALFWSEIVPRGARIDVATKPPDEPEVGAPAATESMARAEYSGVDHLGRPFTLTADHVFSPEQDESVLRLSHPSGRIVLTDGSDATLEALDGTYDRALDKLDLHGNVTFRHGDLTAVSTFASIDVKASEASGDEPVEGTGSFGRITGEGFRIRDDGNTVSVTGPARMLILPGAKPILQ